MNIVIYTNILTPYRKNLYDSLYTQCIEAGHRFHVVVMSETEPDRVWRYHDLKTEYSVLLSGKTLSLAGAYIHINRGLKAVLKRLKPDVLICAGGYLCPGIWQALRWRKELSYQVYFWSESHLKEEKQRRPSAVRLREFIRNRIYRRFDGFWYAGELSKELILRYSSAGADLLFVPNLVEEAIFGEAYDVPEPDVNRIKSELELPKDKIIMLCPARLTQVKGIDRFLEIFSYSEVRDSFCILLAGEGEMKEPIRQIAEKNRLDVRILGYCSQREMVELYAVSDILLLPSLSDPNPLTCIEALWAGLFLLISDHCGNSPEVVARGQNGYVFSYSDKDGLYGALEKLALYDAEQYHRAGAVSRSIAEKNYRTQETARRVIAHHAANIQAKGASD